MKTDSKIFEVKAYKKKKVRLTKKQFAHIKLVHPETARETKKIKETLKNPDFIKLGNSIDTLLFYKLFKKTIVSKKYMVVVVKYVNYPQLKQWAS